MRASAMFASRPPSFVRRQRGAVMYVTMVVLVALALAALALLRSVDVAGLVANNLSFKRSALNATDIGTDQALTTWSALNAANALFNSDATKCYSAVIVNIDSHGVPTLLGNTATFDATYGNCKLSVSATGETVRYYIDRQCSQTGEVFGAIDPSSLNVCTLSNRLTSLTDNFSPGQLPTKLPVYRITLRTDGPRNSVSFAQVIMKPGP